MGVAEATSTNGGYKTFSSTNSTLATALSDVLNELETHHVPLQRVQFVFTSDGTNFSFVAIVKNH